MTPASLRLIAFGAVFVDGDSLCLGGAGHRFLRRCAPVALTRDHTTLAARSVPAADHGPARLRTMSHAADAKPGPRGPFARAASFRLFTGIEMPLQLSPLRGAFGSTASVPSWLGASLLTLDRNNQRLLAGVVAKHDSGKSWKATMTMGTGSGKTQNFVMPGSTGMGMGTLLGSALELWAIQRSCERARDEYEANDFTRLLLSSAEQNTHLPSITSPSVLASSGSWGTGPLASFDELTKVAALAEQLWHVAVALLDEALNPPNFEPGSPTPCFESSPCGVIRLAAPRVPRAPAGPACSSASFILGVLAA